MFKKIIRTLAFSLLAATLPLTAQVAQAVTRVDAVRFVPLIGHKLLAPIEVCTVAPNCAPDVITNYCETRVWNPQIAAWTHRIVSQRVVTPDRNTVILCSKISNYPVTAAAR